jgi:polar amino acid transport system substrate-binding protein
MDPTNVPYEFRSQSDPNTIMGFDPDMIAAAMQCLGLKYEYSAIDFSGLIPALQASQIDMVWSALLYTPERAKVVDFVNYQQAGTGAIVQKGNPKSIHALDDVCGKQAIAVLGTVEEMAFRDQSSKCEAAGKPAIDVSTYPNAAAATLALQNGRGDVFMGDLVQTDQIVANSPAAFEQAYKIISGLEFGVAVAKNNPDLLNAVYHAIQALQANGTETQLLQQHGIDTTLQLPAVIQQQ